MSNKSTHVIDHPVQDSGSDRMGSLESNSEKPRRKSKMKKHNNKDNGNCNDNGQRNRSSTNNNSNNNNNNKSNKSVSKGSAVAHRPKTVSHDEFIARLRNRIVSGGKGISRTRNLDKLSSQDKQKQKRRADDEDYDDIDTEPAQDYCKGGYHPVQIGDTLCNNRYHVVCKLGWGYFSTVWLAWDSDLKRFVAVKILKSAENYREAALDEIRLMKDLSQGDPEHKEPVLHMLNDFVIRGPNGRHICLVCEVAGDNLLTLIRKYDYRGIPIAMVKQIMTDVLSGLHYMHSKCKIIHTDLKPENILVTTPSLMIQKAIKEYRIPADKDVPLEERDVSQLNKQQRKRLRQRLKKRQEQEGQGSADAKLADAPSHSSSTSSDIPISEKSKDADSDMESLKPVFDNDERNMRVKIADFGNACWTFKRFSEEIQTRQYRAPEVIVQQKYDTSADIWSAACIAFELATGDYLFDPKKGSTFNRDDDHLAQMIELIGDFPQEITKLGRKSVRYFDRNGQLKRIRDLKSWRLKDVLIEKYEFKVDDAKLFASFLSPMLHFNKDKRASAEECLRHPWLNIDNEGQENSNDVHISAADEGDKQSNATEQNGSIEEGNKASSLSDAAAAATTKGKSNLENDDPEQKQACDQNTELRVIKLQSASAQYDAQRREAFSVRRAVFVEEQKIDEQIEWDEFDKIQDDSVCEHFLCYRNERPIGTARVLKSYLVESADQPYPQSLLGTRVHKIGRFAVVQDERSCGVGSTIMRHILDNYRRCLKDHNDNQVNLFYLGAQTSACPFYERHGFRVVGEEFEEAGIPHRHMVCDL